jgi:hypothetical protein
VHSAITKLLSFSGEPIGSATDRNETERYLSKWGGRGDEFAEILSRNNGFYAFDDALFVRPLHRASPPLGLAEWNADSLWKNRYVEDLTGVLFFAEDLFGVQFCIRNGAVCTFDPETAAFEEMSASIGEWAAEILADPAFRTGQPLAISWQAKNGHLLRGQRLIPKTPFVLGGKYEIENLYAIGDVEGMLYRSTIASQIRDLPDGSSVEINVIPPPGVPGSSKS